jgi:2-oxo-4-hydroxy-4-carboxy-5-ureidoimidazoline decarboxylase
MEIEEFDVMDAAEASSLVSACADIPSWVEAVVAGRPYADPEHLFTRADQLATRWTGAEVERALADHPRIGERHSGSGSGAALSAREQSGVDPADVEVQARLVEGNRAYEERFDRIFLVRAAGRSAEEMLALLEQRLQNDPAVELDVTAGQLREIASLRLRGQFA